MNVSTKYIASDDIDETEMYLNKYSINSVPVVDENMNVIKILFRDFSSVDSTKVHSRVLKGVPVVIMAGGKGTRLYPYTMVLPKPLIPVSGIPIIERIIKRFIEYGVDSFYLSVNYKKSMIKAYFEELNLPCNIKYIEEDKPLGTGGSLKLIEDKINKPLIVTNCDILIDSDLDDIYKQHIKSLNPITIVAALKNITVPYGVLKVKEKCILEELQEKPINSYFVNTGMYIINPEVLDLIPNDTFFHMTHLVQESMRKNQNVGVYPISEESFLDMGEFKEMKRMEEKL